MNSTTSQDNFRWRFFRAGGFDQVRIETATELLSLFTLDQKLWVALSCPVKGSEFDAVTLGLVDSDNDGHIRAPELLSAIEWAGQRLSLPQVLEQGLAGVPLSAIQTGDELGQQIAECAREVLATNANENNLVTVAMAASAQERWTERALKEWTAQGEPTALLGDKTPDAYAAFLAIREKLDDWFVRCDLAAFDDRAGAALSASGEALDALAGTSLQPDSAGINAMPLSRIAAPGVLALNAGVNPAWQQRLTSFATLVVAPLLGAQSTLNAGQWQQIKAALSPYGKWIDSKPDATAQSPGTRELEKLARYVRDLMALANNFVSFRDFYSRQGQAMFQVGTLYLDSRSCELCVAVNDTAKHAALALLSRICLVYVDCVRGSEKMQVAAAMTAGDSDQLIVGRNGVFYDRQGRDWNATITRIVEHPISLRQAFWSPYKRLARLVSEQLQKIASGKAKESEERIAASAQEVAKKANGAPTTVPPASKNSPKQEPPFDVAKFAGIFAAIGLAIGALGTAFASFMAGLFTLSWWQVPIALAGLMLMVSGPAVIVAWFKLGSRNLGPLLDANGWAINARARINIPFGTSLTRLAQLPAHAERALTDPYADKKSPWKLYVAVVILAVLAGAAWRAGLVKLSI